MAEGVLAQAFEREALFKVEERKGLVAKTEVLEAINRRKEMVEEARCDGWRHSSPPSGFLMALTGCTTRL